MDDHLPRVCCREHAVQVAALDGWTLLSNEDRDAAFGEIVRLTVEIARLRVALEQAVMHLERGGDWTTMAPIINALGVARAALAGGAE